MSSSAVLWALTSSVLFTVANALVKWIGPALPATEISLFRALGGLLLIAVAWTEFRTLRRLADARMHLVRGALGAVTIVALMHAFATLPMAVTTTVYYGRVVLMIPLAHLFLGERMGRGLWAAAIIGLFGAAITLGATLSVGHFSTGVAALLVATITSAGSQVAATRLTRTNPPAVIVCVFGIVTLTVLSLPAAASWVAPSAIGILILAALGLTGAAAQYAVTRAYALAGAGRIAPISYVEIPLAAAIGWIMASELPSLRQVCGALIIVAATAYVSTRRAVSQVSPDRSTTAASASSGDKDPRHDHVDPLARLASYSTGRSIR